MKSGLVLKCLFLAAIVSISSVGAQDKNDSSNQALTKEIARMDSILFNAFNKRDTLLFKTLFTVDMEFYHDKSGLTNYQHTVDFMKGVAIPGNDLTRELVKGSLEVYPVPGYGAMQMGVHKFCHTENGKYGCGTFKFVHIWQKKNNEWKISRVISYDH